MSIPADRKTLDLFEDLERIALTDWHEKVTANARMETHTAADHILAFDARVFLNMVRERIADITERMA